MSNIISPEIKEASKLTSEEWKEWTKTVWSIANISDSIHPAVYPPEIPYRLIRMFSFVGETVLDPFSGMATTGRVALQNNRSYIGFETNPVYHNESLRRLGESVLPENGYDCRYEVSNSSSCDMSHIKENSVGIVVTSPPYWNKADYGEYDGNIGGFEYYDDFLGELQKVFVECYRVLKPGRKMCVVTANVNQNTKEHGLLTIPLATDMTKVLQSCGFALINQIIWNKMVPAEDGDPQIPRDLFLVATPIHLISLLRTSMSIISSFKNPIPKRKTQKLLLMMNCSEMNLFNKNGVAD